MLDRVENSRSTAQGPDGGAAALVSYAEIGLFLRRYCWTILAFIAISLAIAAAYVLTATPEFTARAQLLIDARIPTILREQTGETGNPIDSPQVESQIAVLRSEEIALTVIDKLGLRKHPEFAAPPPGFAARLLSLATGKPPEPPRFDSEAEASRLAIRLFLSRLDVRREGMSHAIDITFTAFDPSLAADIANAIAEAYVADQLATRARTVRQGTEWLEERIEQIRNRMNAAALTVQEFKAKRDYRIKRDRENGAAGAAGGDAERSDSNTLDELESRAFAYRKIYENLLQTYAQTVELQSFPVANARIITKAARPSSKSYPRTALVLALGLMGGALVGFGFSFMRYSLDRSVRTAAQIRECIGIECVAQLPRLERIRLFGHGHGAKAHERLLAYVHQVGRHRRGALTRFLEVENAPFSRFTDGMKRVKTALSLTIKAQPIRCIGLSSALPGEGKSTVSANLAGIYASSGQRTIIVDADIHNSAISRAFAPKAQSGLIEVLNGAAKVQDCIVRCRDGLDVLPTASSQRVAHSNNLLASERMQRLLRELTESYDIVIVDLPPVQPVVDALAVGSFLDAVLLIAEWGRTPVNLLAETARALRMARATLLGVVLTKVAPNAIDDYGSAVMARYY
jgi:capsular exopolysaccharide synthesis family protein